MASLNKVILIGNLGKDPEERFFTDGSPVTNFSIACTEKYKDKTGEQKELTEWVNIVTFGKLAEIAGKYLSKGSSVYIEGKLKTDKYTDKNGIERTATKVICSNLQMLSGSKSNNDQKPAQNSDSGAKGTDLNALEDDIPF